MSHKYHRSLAVIICAGLIVGCLPVGTPTAAPPDSTAPPDASPETTSAPSATPEPALLASLRVPEIASADDEIVYTQTQRANLGGRDMLLWPDGNIGFIPYDGQYRFFAANGPVGARTVGTIEDPGAEVESNRLLIGGVFSGFAYVAGGPVYFDPVSGMLLMFYHAERHFRGGTLFHAELGLAVSHDKGETFEDLGIILKTNAPINEDAPCCADMGGSPYIIKDGQFYVYFRDRQATGQEVELAVATAPVEEVIEAAKAGTTSPWRKYFDGRFTEPGLGGRSSPIEVGNPPTDWFSVSYNTALNRYILAVSTHPRTATYDYSLELAASDDGILWSPRVKLAETELDLTYPTIIDPDGDPLNTHTKFYIYYITTPRDVLRWHATPLHRMTVKLTGNMIELPHEWEFETDAGGWTPLNQIPAMTIADGALVIEPTGNDPYMQSPVLGISSEEYTRIEVRLKTSANGNGQFFFTTSDTPGISEAASVRFPITGSADFRTYTVDMSGNPLWRGLIGTLRFDPTDQEARVDIDYIRLIP